MAANGGNRPRLDRAWLAWLLIALLLAAVGAGWWLLPRLPLAGPTPLPTILLPTATLTPTTLLPTATPTPTTLLPTATSTPTITPSPTPAVLRPTILSHSADVDDRAGAVTFRLEAEVAPDQNVAQAILWYDTAAGHQLLRTDGPLPARVSLEYRLEAAREGLTRTLTSTPELDYWWLVRDTAGESVRAGGIAMLGPNLQAMVKAPAPEPPPLDFAWVVSGTTHFLFHYAPGDAAERDLSGLGALAEMAFNRIRDALALDYEGQMSIYLVPRVFWQGGATYGGKVQLISYLDRNYTGVETWSYFTHEGTHALAQDLIQPKENGGGPDGVLVEGLAVWASSGHYRLEPIDTWAAVVAASDEYLPLASLRAGPFYDFQHETSYLEAGSFCKFLIERYGLEPFKELYGRATGKTDADEELVLRLYGKGYAALEADWLSYLRTLSPTPEQAEAWRLRVRSFDLMRRYETELDPPARVLPDKPPSDWVTDTLKNFLHRQQAPANLVLETALIAAQERMNGGDLEGASLILDDVEAALDAGGQLSRPGLQQRQAILDLIAAQDRAVLRADLAAYLGTFDPAYAPPATLQETLQLPVTAYRQELVRLDVADDGRSARGTVLVHAQVADGYWAENGRLFAIALVRQDGGWRMTSREPTAPLLTLPPRP